MRLFVVDWVEKARQFFLSDCQLPELYSSSRVLDHRNQQGTPEQLHQQVATNTTNLEGTSKLRDVLDEHRHIKDLEASTSSTTISPQLTTGTPQFSKDSFSYFVESVLEGTYMGTVHLPNQL